VHDWWPEDGRPARVLIEVRPALRFEEAIMTRWGLAAAGRTNDRGRRIRLLLSAAVVRVVESAPRGRISSLVFPW
jgi:hypothetical protein